MTTPTQNKFKSTAVYGAFINDDYPDASVLADATFKNNITTTGDLTLNGKTDVSIMNNASTIVTTTQKILGDIVLNGGDITLNSGVTTVVTKNLAGSTLSTVNTSVSGGLNCQLINNYGHLNQWKGGNLKIYDTSNLAHSLIYTSSGTLNIRTYNVATYPVLFYCTKLQHSPNNGVNTYDVLTTQTGVSSSTLSNYALLASPTFTGVPLAPTATLTDSTTQIATTAFVKNQGYLTSVSTAYAPTINPSLGANNYASITAIASTYQTITGMSSYLTTALASSTYQLKTGMSTYAPLTNPTFLGSINTPGVNVTSGVIEISNFGSFYTLIDFKTTNTDYDCRISQTSGVTGTAGKGSMVFDGNNFAFNGPIINTTINSPTINSPNFTGTPNLGTGATITGGVNHTDGSYTFYNSVPIYFYGPVMSTVISMRNTGSSTLVIDGNISSVWVPTSAYHLCNKTYVDSISPGSLNNQFSKAKILI